MPAFVIYLLKLSISLAVVWLFYQFVLRRLTFYGWNRWYLLGYAVVAFFIPAVNVTRMVENGHLASAAIIRYIPLIGDPQNMQTPANLNVAAPGRLPGLISWDLLLASLALGSGFLLIRLVARWVSLLRLRRRASLIGDAGSSVKIYQVEGRIIPFSFGDAIYINRQQHTDKEWEEIILHEYVHIRQRHTVDILLAELLCIFNWYNPFAWLIRHAIRQNLEFIADSKVLENGHDKKGYQYHLLQVIGESRYRLANNFNFSSLKKRIIMMNKIKTARLHLVKFLFILPLVAVLLLAFRSRYSAAARGSVAQKSPVAAAADSLPPHTDRHKETVSRLSPMEIVYPGMRPRPDSLRQPIFFVDGVESVDGKDRSGNPLNKINPNDIERIDVFGPDSARKVCGEKGKNGAIFIYMKHGIIKDSILKEHAAAGRDTLDTVIGSPDKDSLRVAHRTPAEEEDDRARPASLTVADSFKGLILLNGKAISAKELNSLDDTKIIRYDAQAGNDETVKQYGEAARNGVILVTTR